MLDLIGKKSIELAFELSRDYLKAKIEEWNKKAVQKKLSNKLFREGERLENSINSVNLSDEDLPISILTGDETAVASIPLSASEIRQSVNAYLENKSKWASRVVFADLKGSKKTLDIYVDTDIFLKPARLHVDPVERGHTLPLTTAVLGRVSHCLILGQPGAGKTTAMKNIYLAAMDPSSHASKFDFPLLLLFRELSISPSNGVLDELAKIFSFRLDFGGALKASAAARDVEELKVQTFLRFLDTIKVIIVLDGFDELPDNEKKAQIATEINRIAAQLSSAKIVMTCRTAEYTYNTENFEVFEIAPLRPSQIEDFSHRWIVDTEKAKKFVADVYSSPFSDTAIKPLSLAHLCAIYERIGKIPDKPKTVYRKLVGLLLDEWNEQHGIRKESNYAEFGSDRKAEFLAHLAYYLTTETHSTVFDRVTFLRAYKAICSNFGLESNQGKLVAAEIESHTGLFVQSGFEQFEFAHKSLQEYLSAEYIVKLPSIPSDKLLLEGLGAEIAVAVALSSNPGAYISDLVFRVAHNARLPRAFFVTLINRMLLEKPDFAKTEAVFVALYSILSVWINSGKSASGHETNLEKINEELYKQILLLVGEREAAKAFGDCYDLLELSFRQESFLLGKRKKHAVSFEIPDYLLVPRSYAKTSLMS